MKIIYSPQARDDLIRLREFIAIHNPQTASRISRELKQGIQKLKITPFLGVSVKQAPDPEHIRDLILERYIVRYLIYNDRIFILRIWHHRENRDSDTDNL